MKNQETEGLLSPLIRNVRLRRAAALIERGSVVLDLACGAGFLREFLPEGCRYFGVDRITPPRVDRFDGFFDGDLTHDAALDALKAELPGKADVVTMLAFVEHLREPGDLLARLKGLVRPGGKVILTTPHPVGRNLHDSLARLYLCSRSGAAEHERFLDRHDLERLASDAGYNVSRYQRFLFGLNQIVELAPVRR